MIMIVCTDKDWAIGYKGGLIYRIREDMNHFRKLTMGHPVVMGRKTLKASVSHYRAERILSLRVILQK